jgi:polysaccharide pyruvyl transferase WcaK-like protein
LRSQSVTADIGGWRDLVAALQDADVVVASRLHSLILALLVRKPSVAISFDPKVDWLMEDLEQTDLLLNIRDFAADEVVAAVDRLFDDVAARRAAVDAYMSRATQRLARQFDELAGLVEPPA